MIPEAEQIYTIDDWWDGIIAAIVDYHGQHHYCCAYWDEARDCFSDIFLLVPIDDETFGLALVQWQIWLRWEADFKAGLVAPETHPGLTGTNARYKEISHLLDAKLDLNASTAFRMKAAFHYEKSGNETTKMHTSVQWFPLEETDDQTNLRLWNVKTSSFQEDD